VLAFGTRPSPTQWLGMALLLLTVVALSLHEQRSTRPAVVTRTPDPALPR
jgi:drug/metabolite transporter (DMT)-like permease